ESQSEQTASLFGESELPPHERKILKLLKADEATHIDEIVESLEADLSSSENFAALFELELAGKVKQMPGKNFREELLAISFRLLAQKGRFGDGRLQGLACVAEGVRDNARRV